MNPLFGMMGGSNVGNMMQMISQIRQARQNPNMLADLLVQNGKINQSQYEQIRQFNGDPQKIGEYLMQNGVMPQQQVQQAYQNVVPQIQNELYKTN